MSKLHSSFPLILTLLGLAGPLINRHYAVAWEPVALTLEKSTPFAEDCGPNKSQIIATQLHTSLDTPTFPGTDAWNKAQSVTFCGDWKGEHTDPQRMTEVRMLWSAQFLYLRFEAHYRDIYLYPEANQRREKVWLRDVAEVFLQPKGSQARYYKEFDVSPNGNWIDLDISPAGGTELLCDVKTKAVIASDKHIWITELIIPMKCLTRNFDRNADWRLNLFRIEGSSPYRFYSAWRPTNSELPNFHVPEVFGTLRFSHD